MKLHNTKRSYSEKLKDIEALAQVLPAVSIMEICGTHTMAIGRSGLRQLLPDNIKLISGPGCPVCVTHDREIDNYLELAKDKRVIIATFGDLLRVPGSKGTLAAARSQGAGVVVVYSTLEALRLASNNPDHEVVFLGVGFETTAPTAALSIIQAKSQGLRNYSVYSMHKLVPPVLEALLRDGSVKLDGFICPGHVSTIIGTSPYTFIAEQHKKPCAITGFEIHDILDGLHLLLMQMRQNKAKIDIQYIRGVKPDGNPIARKTMDTVFRTGDVLWRGFGVIPNSGLHIREEYRDYDASVKFGFAMDHHYKYDKEEICSCGDILKGLKTPNECDLFKGSCTPLNPFGPCMVSSEGACAAYYRYEA